MSDDTVWYFVPGNKVRDLMPVRQIGRNVAAVMFRRAYVNALSVAHILTVQAGYSYPYVAIVYGTITRSDGDGGVMRIQGVYEIVNSSRILHTSRNGYTPEFIEDSLHE